MGVVIDTRIKKAVTFHDVLHGFHIGRGMGTSIMELKLAQDLASVDQDPIFLVFLDLRKSYDNLYHGYLLQTLDGYGVGTNIQVILVEFWSRQEVVTR